MTYSLLTLNSEQRTVIDAGGFGNRCTLLLYAVIVAEAVSKPRARESEAIWQQFQGRIRRVPAPQPKRGNRSSREFQRLIGASGPSNFSPHCTLPGTVFNLQTLSNV